MNGPLQERGSALDRDVTRANTLPTDYDTDLESEWVNESNEPCFRSNEAQSICLVELFADGDDFSWATIQKGRNRYYQQQMVEMNNRRVQDMTLCSSSRPIQSAIRVHKHFR